jgi:hypothetical protein
MKSCTKCGQTKPLTQYPINKKLISGREGRCCECRNQYQREWRAQNIEASRAATKRWREKNPSTVQANKQRYGRTEKAKQTAKEWEKRNKEKRQRQNRGWEQKNKNHRLALWNEWARKNPDNIKHSQQKRRALQMGSEVLFTLDAKQRIIRKANGFCYYCNTRSERLSLDHVLPLSRGGRHSEGNIVVCCMSCNSSKKNNLLVVWRYTRRKCWFDAKGENR